MNKKLTLTIDDKIIEFAHHYSKETDQSISAMVEKYFRNLQRSNQDSDFSPVTLKLRGVLKGHTVPEKHELRRMFHEKNLD
ncbi:MAG: DUF6364 family protein [Spirochaetaceae bacterium]|nr:DUF6364 family protein [Spirochaetaceae bacterium]